jgi:pentatricopeptide repeat protein
VLEQKMLAFLQQKEFTRALSIFRGLERDGRDCDIHSEELLSSFVVTAIRVEKYDVVEKMLRLAKRNDVEFTVKSWRTFLKMLSTKKCYSLCLMTATIFGKAIPEDQVVYSCLVNAALDANVPQEAAEILLKYKSSDVEPKDWILFFRTYAATSDSDAAEALFSEVGDAMTPLMLNLLLLTCVNAKQPERALACLNQANALEKEKDVRITNTVSYNTVIKGFSQDGDIERCFYCLNGLFEHGLEPDDATLAVLVDVCTHDTGVSVADRLVQLLKQANAPSTTVMCTHFLKLLIKTNRIDDAMKLYQDMKGREQTRPDVVTCSILIKAFVATRDLNRAMAVVDDMIASGCRPDDMILTRLLEGHRQAGLCEEGVRIFERFVTIGVKPSEHSILTLLKLYGVSGNHEAAFCIVEMCEQCFGTRLSVIHYTCLMSGALRNRGYDQAWKAYLLMLSKGVKLDDTAVSILLPGLVAAQRWDRVLELVASALTETTPALRIPSEMLNNALGGMLCARASRDDMHRLQLLMQGAGVPITTRNADRLK